MSKIIQIIFAILVGVGVGIVTLAFTGPSQSPPSGNPDFWIKPSSILYYTGGNVGIGQTSATDKLEVTGNIKATGNINAISNLCINSDCKSSWASIASSSGWVDGGTSVYLITATDNVAIGTATVDSNYKITTASGGIKAESTTQPAGYFNSTSGYGLIVNAGNVGIGTTTPGAKLDVVGQIRITGGTPGVGKFLTSDASGLASWTTGVSSVSNSDGTLTVSPTSSAVIASINLGHANTWTAVQTFNATSSFSGNVGIGTASPSEKLEVTGNIKLSGATPTYRLTNVASPTASSDVATKGYVDAITGTTLSVYKYDGTTELGVFAGFVDTSSSTPPDADCNGWAYTDSNDMIDILENGTDCYTRTSSGRKIYYDTADCAGSVVGLSWDEDPIKYCDGVKCVAAPLFNWVSSNWESYSNGVGVCTNQAGGSGSINTRLTNYSAPLCGLGPCKIK